MSSAVSSTYARDKPPPETTVVRMLETSVIMRTLAVLVNAGVADALAKLQADAAPASSPSPSAESAATAAAPAVAAAPSEAVLGARPAVSIAALAHATGLDADALTRGLRGCATHGVFELPTPSTVRHNVASIGLVDGPFAPLVKYRSHPTHWKIWSHADAVFQPGGPSNLAALRAAFPNTPVAHSWDVFQLPENDKLMRTFNDAMTGNSRITAPAVTSAFPPEYWRKFSVVVDVAGGTGCLVGAVLKQAPAARGVVAEMKVVVDAAEAERASLFSADVDARLKFVECDMFADVPAGDLFLLKHILHDWGDEMCLKLLATVRRRAAAGATVIVIETLMPDAVQPFNVAPSRDLLMMVITAGGRERTRAEYAQLFERTGWRLDEVRDAPQTTVQAIVATAV